ncbi:MAG: hypothetical protein ACLS9K_01285 [Lachnospira eligens]
MQRRRHCQSLQHHLLYIPRFLRTSGLQIRHSTDDADVKAAVEAVANALGADGRILVRESGTEPLSV